jgi:signal transduction histidine kinase
VIDTIPGNVSAKRTLVGYFLFLAAACTLPVLFLSMFLLYWLCDTQNEITGEQTLGIASGGILLLAAGIAISVAMGRRIRRSVDELTAAVIALGQGQELPPTPASSARELAVLRDALGAAKHLLDGERRRRSATEAELRHSYEGLVLAQRIAALGSWEFDIESGRVVWSDEMYRMCSRSRERFTPDAGSMLSTVHEDDRGHVRDWLGALSAGCIVSGVEFRIVRVGGEIRTVRSEGRAIRNDHGKVIKVAGTMQDVTARALLEQRRREADAQIHHSQKLQALGTLAGGIAHEFNNDLLAIAGLLDMVLDQLPDDSPTVRPLRRAGDAIEHARDVVRQILIFSRRDEPQRERLRADIAVSAALDQLQASLPNNVRLRRHLVSHDDILVDRSQLRQIVLNLGVNAAHAIVGATADDRSRTGDGLLEVRLDTITVGTDREEGVPPDLPDGSYVRLSFVDNGQGIPAVVLDRIFEPFFTTKPPGDGTGLGLAVVHGIAAAHGGGVTAESREGQGARIAVFFPRARREEAASPTAIRVPNAASA